LDDGKDDKLRFRLLLLLVVVWVDVEVEVDVTLRIRSVGPKGSSDIDTRKHVLALRAAAVHQNRDYQKQRQNIHMRVDLGLLFVMLTIDTKNVWLSVCSTGTKTPLWLWSCLCHVWEKSCTRWLATVLIHLKMKLYYTHQILLSCHPLSVIDLLFLYIEKLRIASGMGIEILNFSYHLKCCCLQKIDLKRS
jgi:hypothetical protein